VKVLIFFLVIIVVKSRDSLASKALKLGLGFVHSLDVLVDSAFKAVDKL